MGASKRAKNIRTEDEFDFARIKQRLEQPREGTNAVYSYSLEDILAARNAQLRGHFWLAARMAVAMRTSSAIFVPQRNRLDPERNVPIEIVAPDKKSKTLSVAAECSALYGQDGVGVSPGTRSDINLCLADHGIAFGYNVSTPRSDGSRIDIEHRYWPIQYVRWDAYRRKFLARVNPTTAAKGDLVVQDPALGFAAGYEVEINHGDGRWVIYSSHEVDAFAKEAAIIPGCLLWYACAFAERDWSKGSKTHAMAKFVGQMPPGVVLQNKDGSLTAQAKAMLELLIDFANGDSMSGILPAGATSQFLVNTSTAWQIFSELVKHKEQAGARIYLGTDAILGSKGGAPGVDLTQLFGVAITKVRGDLGCMERGFQTGVVEPWCAMNFGDSTLAPKRRYMLPDPDKAAWRAGIATRRTAFFTDIKSARDNGFVVDKEYVENAAEEYDVTAPTLPEETDATAPTIALAPPDLANVITVNEARASAGLGGLMLADGVTTDPDGSLTVGQFAAKKAAELAPAPAAGAPPAPAQAADLEKALASIDVRLRDLSERPAKPAAFEKPPAPPERSFAERSAAFQADLKDYRANGLCLNQAELEQLAKLHNVPAPRLASEGT